jgi:MOSC domain-containing protein YiiM
MGQSDERARGSEERPATGTARLASINVSPGGVPKRAIPECRIGALGLEGDRQNDRRHHGGPERAVVLFSLERILELQAEGHPIAPGTIGENLTLEGVDWRRVVPGARLEVGAVRLEVTRFCSPCEKIGGSFREHDFVRVSEKVHPGGSRVCARVVKEGTVRVGAPVRLGAASEEGDPGDGVS